LVSTIGSWMQTVALGVVVTADTHKPFWTGMVAAAAFVPIGLLSPVGGALADRLDRRRWLLVTTFAEAIIAAVLAVLAATNHDPPWALTVMAFLGGVASAVGFPAYQAILPDLVPRDELLAAVSLSSAQFNLGRVVGPALTGVVLVAGSAAWAFAINAASFGAVLLALVLVSLPPRSVSRTSIEPIARRIREGARIAAGEPGCRSAIVLIGIVALVGSPFIALVPAMAINGLDAGAGGTAALVTAQGVGAVCVALLMAWLARALGRGRLAVLALFAFPSALVWYGASPTLVLAALAVFAVGGCYLGVLSGLNTVVQLNAPDHARGRVLGLYMMALGTLYPVGAVVEGSIANAIGIRSTTVGAGVLLLAVMATIGVVRPALFDGLGNSGHHGT
jgi:MFS family permease